MLLNIAKATSGTRLVGWRSLPMHEPEMRVLLARSHTLVQDKLKGRVGLEVSLRS